MSGRLESSVAIPTIVDGDAYMEWDDDELVPRIVDIDASWEWDDDPELEGGDL